MIDAATAVRHLEADRRRGALPEEWARDARRARNRLKQPINFLPHTAIVSIRIDLPSNDGGNFDGIAYRCDEATGLSVEEARQELTKLMQVFIDHILPLPA